MGASHPITVLPGESSETRGTANVMVGTHWTPVILLLFVPFLARSPLAVFFILWLE